MGLIGCLLISTQQRFHVMFNGLFTQRINVSLTIRGYLIISSYLSSLLIMVQQLLFRNTCVEYEEARSFFYRLNNKLFYNSIQLILEQLPFN